MNEIDVNGRPISSSEGDNNGGSACSHEILNLFTLETVPIELNLEQQLQVKIQECEVSKQEINALKIINAKLLTQLQYERQQKVDTPSKSSPAKNNKKKKTKNTLEESDEQMISEDIIINSTVQDVLIHLQMENQKLSSDILILEEEVVREVTFVLTICCQVSKLTNEKQISSIEVAQLNRLTDQLTLQLEAQISEVISRIRSYDIFLER